MVDFSRVIQEMNNRVAEVDQAYADRRQASHQELLEIVREGEFLMDHRRGRALRKKWKEEQQLKQKQSEEENDA